MSFPRYPAYKPSGVEWLGEVPEHWKALRLRFAVTLNPSKQEAKELGNQEAVSFLPMEAIGEDGSLRLESEKDVSECFSGYTYFRDGDVCIAKITPCFENGKGAILRQLKGGIGFGTTELIVARPATDKITSEFLDYLFRSQAFRRLGESQMYGAGGQKRVPDSFVRDFTATLPSIQEQRQVTIFLDRETARIDALIAEQQRLIELLQEKRQAVISHAVTKGLNPDAPMKDSGVERLGEVPEHWEVGRVKRFLASMNHKRIPLSSEERSTRQGEYPYYGASGVIDSVDDFLFEESLVLVSEDGANLLMRSTPIAFVASGKYWVNNHAHILKPMDGMPVFWSEMIESLQIAPFVTGSAQPKLTAEALMNLMVAAPPEEAEKSGIQKRIQEAMAEFDPLLDASRNSIALLQERRSALISAAVTGQIDVRGLAPEP